jgi:hypothetical protein
MTDPVVMGLSFMLSFFDFLPLKLAWYPFSFLKDAIFRDTSVLLSFSLFLVYSFLEVLYYASAKPINIMRSTMMIRPVLCALLIPAYIISRDRVVEVNIGAPIELGLDLHIEAAVQTISPIAASYIYARRVDESANFFLALTHQQKHNETDGRPINMRQRCGVSTYNIERTPTLCQYEFSYIQFVSLRQLNWSNSKCRFLCPSHTHVPQQRLYVAEFQRIFFNAITVNFLVIICLIVLMQMRGVFPDERQDVLTYTRWRFHRIGIPVLVVCTWVFKHMYVEIKGFPFPDNVTEEGVDHKFVYATMCFSDHILTTLVCYVFLVCPLKFLVDRMHETVGKHEENPYT